LRGGYFDNEDDEAGAGAEVPVEVEVVNVEPGTDLDLSCDIMVEVGEFSGYVPVEVDVTVLVDVNEKIIV
jgi:hypothetical protein